MIPKREILARVTQGLVSPHVLEKDYVLGWILAGIHQHPLLRESFVFKGGTCLKKCYFDTYRFSEDLDFTVTDGAWLQEDRLKTVFTEVAQWVTEATGILIPPERLVFRLYSNPRGNLACEGKLFYQGPLTAASPAQHPRVKIDITADELLVMPPVLHGVKHRYSDCPSQGIQMMCYAYEEIFAEKIRALAERTRPRDLYDVIHFYRRPESAALWAQIRAVLEAKCAFKAIAMPTVDLLLAHRLACSAAWGTQLAHQLPALPPFETFWESLPAFFEWLEGRGTEQALLLPLPDQPIVQVRPSKYYHAQTLQSTLDTIYFAASNHLCLHIEHEKRIDCVEPYTLRIHNTGTHILHGLEHETGALYHIPVHAIDRLTITPTPFLPIYQIECLLAGSSSFSGLASSVSSSSI